MILGLQNKLIEAETKLADYIFKCIFFNCNAWISIKISLMIIPKGPISNIPALAQIRFIELCSIVFV